MDTIKLQEDRSLSAISSVKVEAKPYRGGAKASVYIDYESMDNYVNATGY